MDTASRIDYINMTVNNKTNGSFATYSFYIDPSHLVLSGDILIVNFPP